MKSNFLTQKYTIDKIIHLCDPYGIWNHNTMCTSFTNLFAFFLLSMFLLSISFMCGKQEKLLKIEIWTSKPINLYLLNEDEDKSGYGDGHG